MQSSKRTVNDERRFKMARDLSFWKVKENTQEENSQIYKMLSEGKYLDYIEKLPSEQILQDFKVAFKEWEMTDDFWFENGDEKFQLFLTEQFVRTDCYSMAEENLNKIMDILFEYDCPLYDSSIDVRFE